MYRICSNDHASNDRTEEREKTRKSEPTNRLINVGQKGSKVDLRTCGELYMVSESESDLEWESESQSESESDSDSESQLRVRLGIESSRESKSLRI